MDLLLLTDGSKYYYVLISDLQKLVEYVRHKVHRFQTEICRKCFHTCASFETLRRRQEPCYQYEDVVITMPKPGKVDHKFKNLTARWYVPRVIYFDLESLLLPVYGPQPDPRKYSTQTIEDHQPCGYALAVNEFGKKYLLKFELKRGPSVMEELISSLESLARQIYVEKRKYYTFTGITDQEREDATVCWICENDFSDNDQVVIDHCHYTNKFLGWAQNECNVIRKTTNYIPVVAHNLSNYDLLFIIKALAKSDSENTFSVVPASDEKYISLTISVYIKTNTEKNGKIKKLNENLRFIDSYRFMLASLAKLVDNLPNEKFFLLESYFEKLGH